MTDKQYLEYVRGLCCVRCGEHPPSDPHHLVSRKWREVDRNDYYCLPLCRHCHSLLDLMADDEWLSAWIKPYRKTILATLVADQLVRYFTMSRAEKGI